MPTGSCLCTANKYVISNEEAAVARLVSCSQYLRGNKDDSASSIYIYLLIPPLDNLPLRPLPQDQRGIHHHQPRHTKNVLFCDEHRTAKVDFFLANPIEY